MKNIILAIVALLLVVGSASAQTDAKTWSTGIDRTLGIYKNTSDSVHSIGTLSLIRQNYFKLDSLSIALSYQDSARLALRVKLKNKFGTVTDSATITQIGGDKIIDATAAGMTTYPWFAIRAAFGDKIYGAASLDVEVICYLVGTEIYSSGKKFSVRADIWD